MKKLNFNFKEIIGKLNRKNQAEAPTEEENGKNTGKLFNKVGDMFNYEPERERVLNQEDFKAAGDIYYASVSALYKIAERLLLLVLIIFMVFSLVTNYKEITYNNFFYLLRDFSSAADSQASSYQVLSYDSSDRQNFALYRGGLVSAAPSNVSVFTAGGRRTLRSNNDYYSPSVVCCDKYVLVYDSASSYFSVYNSFSKIHNEKLENPITDACFDKDGAFALATRRNDATTEIFLYGEDINFRGNISNNHFIFDMTLDSANDRLAALYYDNGFGVGVTTVCAYDIGRDANKKTPKEIELDGEFPLACSYLENGKLAVITNASIRIFDKKLKEVEAISFNEAKVSAFNASADGASVAISDGVSKTVVAFDKDGEKIYNNKVSENVSDIDVKGKFIFLQSISGITRINSDNGQSEFLPSSTGKMLLYSDDTAIVCGEAKAEYLVFDRKR